MNMESQDKKIRSLKKLLNSFKYAFNGIKYAFLYEQNMDIHLIVTIIVIAFGIFFKISIIEWLVCLILIGLVIASELINTSLETTIDLISPKYNEKAKVAKDTAAGAVLVFASVAFICGLIIFIPKILCLLSIG